jgi:hypothetical protein
LKGAAYFHGLSQATFIEKSRPLGDRDTLLITDFNPNLEAPEP